MVRDNRIEFMMCYHVLMQTCIIIRNHVVFHSVAVSIVNTCVDT